MCFAGDQTHNTGMLDKHSTAALYPQLHFNILILEKLLNNLTLVIIPLKKKNNWESKTNLMGCSYSIR